MMGALKLENTHILLFKLLIFYELLFYCKIDCSTCVSEGD